MKSKHKSMHGIPKEEDRAVPLCSQLYKSPGAACSGVTCFPGFSKQMEFSGKSIKPHQNQDHRWISAIPTSFKRTTWLETGGLLYTWLTRESLQFLWTSSERGLLRTSVAYTEKLFVLHQSSEAEQSAWL